jgi:hypothetical protein
MFITLRFGTLLTAVALLAAPAIVAADDPSGASKLQELLVRYDRASDLAERDALAREIDRVAHQRYATESRLYWHTDLESAMAEARASGRPILHLRMLGRLDEELSCANSRLFRATLYANREVSAFLREHFVLSWSSERPVPRVTIDFGDGRRLERTATGNSAHYVLDASGRLLDVLPGLYAPVAFRRELERSLVLANRVRDASGVGRVAAVAEYHRQLAAESQQEWTRLADTPWIRGAEQLLTAARVDRDLAAAQRATFTKARMELPDLRAFAPGLAPASIPEDQVEVWASLGQRAYGIGDLVPVVQKPARSRLADLPQDTRLPPPAPPRVIDDNSRALVLRLHNAAPAGLRTPIPDSARLIARLEQTIVADTALNQFRLRPIISAEIARRGGEVEFASLNAWIYDAVFRTPRQDAWLGLLPRDVFTGLPGDGVVLQDAGGTVPEFGK